MQQPKLRFKEFENDFDIFQLNDLCQVVDCQHNTAPVENKPSTYKMIRTSNVRNGRLITETMDSVSEETYHTWSIRGYLQKDDVILTREAPMGEVAIVSREDIKYFLGQRVLQLKSNRSKITPYYLYLLLQSTTFLKYIQPIKSGGSTVSNIRIPELKSMEFQIPRIEEQNKLTSLFKLLNSRIEKQQEKIDKLEQFKKGMMQKIFSQELQFKDEDGGEFPEWEEKQLGQILKIKHGRDQKKIETPDGEYPILATGGTIGRTNTFIYDKESVLIGRKGTIDRPVFMDTPFWTVDTLFYSEIKENNCPKFIFYIFQNINWKLYNEASGVPSLSAKTIEAIKITTPTYKEQKVIADYLSVIDSKIEKEKEKLMVLEERKKGFMQGLFV